MTSIVNSIGQRFEEHFFERFPGFNRTTQDENVPDFYHKSGFWVETKVGNINWGPSLKGYQIYGFRDFPEPVIYALGMHNFDDAIGRLRGKSDKQKKRILKQQMDIVLVYLMNQDILRKIWEKESRVSDAGQEYFQIKTSILRNVFRNRSFTRFGLKVESAERYYGFSIDDFLIQNPEDAKGLGWMLHKEDDAKVIDFLKSVR